MGTEISRHMHVLYTWLGPYLTGNWISEAIGERMYTLLLEKRDHAHMRSLAKEIAGRLYFFTLCLADTYEYDIIRRELHNIATRLYYYEENIQAALYAAHIYTGQSIYVPFFAVIQEDELIAHANIVFAQMHDQEVLECARYLADVLHAHISYLQQFDVSEMALEGEIQCINEFLPKIEGFIHKHLIIRQREMDRVLEEMYDTRIRDIIGAYL